MTPPADPEETTEKLAVQPVDSPTIDHRDTLAAPPEEPPTDDVPAALAAAFGDRYELGAVLGEGGFGSVYRAFDRRLGRHVAVKVSGAAGFSAREADRLLEEARQLAQLRHPGIVVVHDVATAGRRWFIVSELLEGPNLARWLRVNRPTWQEAVTITAQVADALAHAHARSIVHRDIKPANIILVEGSRPVLVDFGIALSDETPTERRDQLIGTPAYMSPEQVRGLANRPDGRTDIYSLGVTLYEMLCGRPPFRSDDTVRLVRMVREDEPQPLRQVRPDLPVDLERISLRALAKSPADRFTTAADFAAELRRLTAGEPQITATDATPTGGNAEARAADRGTAASGAALPSQGERRQVTVVYAAFEPGAADPDMAHEQFVAFEASFRTAVTAFDGLPLPSTGTACLASFGYPTAREDAPRLAVRAALAIRDSVAKLPGSMVRVAVHSGLAIVTRTDDGTASVVGDVATTVTRLDPAGAGGVRISSATFRLIDGYFDCEPAGEVRLRSTGPLTAVFSVTAERDVHNRIDAANPEQLSPLIGRDREVALLRERWELAAEGVGHVVLLVGDPGLGKSRLARAVREYVTGRTGPRVSDGETAPEPGGFTSPSSADVVIDWHCSPHHQASPFSPAIAYFTRAFGLTLEPDPIRKLGRLSAHLKDDGITDPERVALVAGLLSVPVDGLLPPLRLTPERQRQRLADTIAEWLRSRASRHPVLFIVEDLHWVDPSTEELLARIVAECAQARILVVLTSRPEYEPTWHGSTDHTRITLARLTRRQVGELVRVRIGRADLPQDIVDRLANRTDGIPLFVEEFARALTDGGTILAEIPATLQDLLLTRLDRMASNKAVVQLGAAIDRTFGYTLIRAAADIPEAMLRAELDKLVSAGVLLVKGSPPNATYTFKHALIQDAAYLSMVKKRRQEVHRSIAAAIETHLADTVETQPELLAHHATEAGDLRRGVGLWLRAGQRARDRSAHLEAVRHLTRGLESLILEPPGPERDAREIAFRTPLTASCLAIHGYAAPEVETHLQASRELCERLGSSSPRLQLMMLTWAIRLTQGRIELAEELARGLLGLAEVGDDDGLRTEAHWAAGCTAWWAGEFLTARRHLQRADLLYRIDASIEHARFTQQNCGPLLLGYEALALWALGLIDQAEEKLATALALAEDLNHPHTLVATLWLPGHLGVLAGDGERAMECAERVVALAESQSFAFWVARGLGLKGAALSQLGRHAEAVPVLRDSLARIEATGCLKQHQTSLWALAGSLWRLGRQSEAWAALNRALTINDRDKERYLEAELYRRKAEFLLDQSERNEYDATVCLVKAIEVARLQYARFFDLRASLDLARMWAPTRRREARELLGPAVDGFTEGRDTPDVAAARAFLAWLG